jgi:hypothetical protein
MKKSSRLLHLWSLLMLCGIATTATADESGNWRLTTAEDPLSDQTTCLMVSAVKHIDDGQTNTPVTVIYNGKVFVVQTKSNIDLSYPNLGLQVDSSKPVAIDRVYKSTDVIFESAAEQIRNEFIKGLDARLTLGFWPTWPKTRSYTVAFDLRGFTKTYEAFHQCQQNSELP